MNKNKQLLSIKLIFSIPLLTAIFVLGVLANVDPAFNTTLFGVGNGRVVEIVEQSDGKILVAGDFLEANGLRAPSITRINNDGSIDQTFNPPILYRGFNGPGDLTSIAIQSNGKILIGGRLRGLAIEDNAGVYRLNTDGTLDTTFTTVEITNEIYDIAVQSDDKILVIGNNSMLRRLNPNGTDDVSVSISTRSNKLAVLPNDKIYLSGESQEAFRRFNSDLSADTSFATIISIGNNEARDIENFAVLPNGQVIVTGQFTNLNGFFVGRIARVNADGSLDLNFNINGIGANNKINDISIKSDGKIVITGIFSTYNGQVRNKVAQLNTDGTLDTSFQITEPVDRTAFSILVNSSDEILVGQNSFQDFANNIQNSLIKYDPNGNFVSSFYTKLSYGGTVTSIEVQGNGKIYVSGAFLFANGIAAKGFVRLNEDGTVDETFSSGVSVGKFAVQTDGKLLVSGSSGIFRLNTDGTIDATFNQINLGTRDIKILPDGKILIISNRRVRRYNSIGQLDNTFSQITFDGDLNKLALQPDGKILVGGNFNFADGNVRGRIARLNEDGTFDASFNPPGGANAEVLEIKIQPDGKVLLGGKFNLLNGNNSHQGIGRLNTDGTIDTSFFSIINSNVEAIKILDDGKILVGGTMSFVNSVLRIGFARLNSDGSLDDTITASSPGGVFGLDTQSDGKILIVGAFSTVNGISHNKIARLLIGPVASSLTQFDFDGDGLADIGVFRPSTNIWYQLLGPNYNFSQTSFGIANDIVAPADFDGDGKTDLAIFRPASGDWWYLSSATNTQVNVQFGQNGDIPRPSDFDGDGKADFILFRPSTSQWFRFASTGATSTVKFGLTGDKPLVGDFDGDGKSDVAIYRPSTGDWWWQSSVDSGQRATHWGISTDIPSPGDYDGDGITDFAVYRPEAGVWYVLNSSSGNTSATIIQFGISEDKPVPADYDGDGKTDIAVYRPSTGIWYLLRSTAGFQALQFGISTDIPVQNALIPSF